MCTMTLKDAMDLAERLHAGQVDKAEQPYFGYHVMPVHDLVWQWGGDVHQRIIAVLHDVVEDTGMTLDALRKAGYCDRIVDGIDRVTRRINADGTKESYHDGLIARAASHPDSRIVKMADNRHNYSTLHNLPVDVASGMRRRYTQAWKMLLEADK